MDAALLLGFFGSVATIVSFAPQAWKIIRTRRTADISAGMYAISVFGFLCWAAYGIVTGQWAIIVTNGTCLVLASFILVLKLLPERESRKLAKKLDPSTPS